MQEDKCFKLVAHKFQGKEYLKMSKSWNYNEAKNKEKEKQGYDNESNRRNSKSVDEADYNKLSEWLIVHYES